MSIQYDLVIENAHIIDPLSPNDGIGNIGIANGKIAIITTDDLANKTNTVLHADGLVAIPGMIDIHTHLGPKGGRGHGACHMLAKAGVTTTLALSGPVDDVFKLVQTHGTGMSVAVLNSTEPEVNLSSNDPNTTEIATFVKKALDDGALGVKILGGHYPLTLEASQRVVEQCTEHNAYFAWHCGSMANVGGIASVRDFFEATKGHSAHLAHVNTYCRGLTHPPLQELNEILQLLEAHPKVFAESYIAATNGLRLSIGPDGRCTSRAAGNYLTFFGFEDSKAGLESAIKQGIMHIFAPSGLETTILKKEAALKHWHDNDCATAGGFDINPPEARFGALLAKNTKGEFIVDALATDGGTHPRNVMIEVGIPLVNAKALTLKEFALKTSYNPSRQLNLHNKGHLSIGADADITLIDMRVAKATTSIANGTIIMHHGIVFGQGGTLITTKQGKAKAMTYGLTVEIVENK